MISSLTDEYLQGRCTNPPPEEGINASRTTNRNWGMKQRFLTRAGRFPGRSGKTTMLLLTSPTSPHVDLIFLSRITIWYSQCRSYYHILVLAAVIAIRIKCYRLKSKNQRHPSSQSSTWMNWLNEFTHLVNDENWLHEDLQYCCTQCANFIYSGLGCRFCLEICVRINIPVSTES